MKHQLCPSNASYLLALYNISSINCTIIVRQVWQRYNWPCGLKRSTQHVRGGVSRTTDGQNTGVQMLDWGKYISLSTCSML